MVRAKNGASLCKCSPKIYGAHLASHAPLISQSEEIYFLPRAIPRIINIISGQESSETHEANQTTNISCLIYLVYAWVFHLPKALMHSADAPLCTRSVVAPILKL